MTFDKLKEKISGWLRGKSVYKCGQLKYFNLDCPDIDQNPIRKASRLFNRTNKHFRIDYFPALKGKALFLTEDASPANRRLVHLAFEKGIETYVVQHGVVGGPTGFFPLIADYLLCWPESLEMLESYGISREKLIPFEPEPPANLKRKNVESVFFLPPPAKNRQTGGGKLYSEHEIINIIDSIIKEDGSLVIKPHPKYFNHLKPLLNGHRKRVTWDRADDLIYSAKRIYSTPNCTTWKDCEVMGKKAIDWKQYALA